METYKGHFSETHRLSSAELKDKLGDKINMSSVIVMLANACLNVESLMKKMQGHNFELRGKVADLSISAVKKLTDEMHGIEARRRL